LTSELPDRNLTHLGEGSKIGARINTEGNWYQWMQARVMQGSLCNVTLGICGQAEIAYYFYLSVCLKVMNPNVHVRI
jgi:hypothetical protein